MKTEKYYFQVRNIDQNWSDVKPSVGEFSNRKDAINAAYLLSEFFKATVRFSDNEYYKVNLGTYIMCKQDAEKLV